MQLSAIVIRCRLSVTRGYCVVTKRLKIGLCGFHQNVAQCLNSLPAKFGDEIQSPLDRGAQSFRLLDAVSRKWCEIGLRSLLITNRKSYKTYGLSIAIEVDDVE